MTDSLNINQSTTVAGKDTQTFTVVTAGIYQVDVNYTIPYIAAGGTGNSASTTGASSLQILVKQGATTKLTLSNPSPNQPSMGGSVSLLCAAADVITVVPSSSAAADAALNAIKGTINIFQGVGG